MSFCTECGREMDDFEAQEWYACKPCRDSMEEQGLSLASVRVPKLEDFQERANTQGEWGMWEGEEDWGVEGRLWLRRAVDGDEDDEEEDEEE